MFTASNMISRAMTFYIPRSRKRKSNKIFVFGKKYRYYCGDRKLYRLEYLKSDHWRQLRSEKLKLNPVCEECGSTKRVEPHHMVYKNLYDIQVSDLKSLCRKCHNAIHTPPQKIRKSKIYLERKQKIRWRKRRMKILRLACRKLHLDIHKYENLFMALKH